MEPQHLIGLGAVFISSLTLAWLVYSSLSTRMQTLSDTISERIDRVETRNQADVHGVRQEVEVVRRDYVRRDDLTLHLDRLEKGQDKLVEKLDGIATTLRHRTTNAEQRLALLEYAVEGMTHRTTLRKIAEPKPPPPEPGQGDGE